MTLEPGPAARHDEPGGHDDLAALLARTAQGDTPAFKRLYGLTAARVFGLATRVTHNRALAEEVTQEVFVYLWQQAAHYRPARGAALSWILTIAHRRAVDCVRSNQASTERDRRVGVRDLPFESDPVAEHVELHVERGHLRIALARLSDVQRESILLAYFDGLSQAQIAERTGAALGTVKTRMRGGLARLRQELQQHADTGIAAA